MYAVGILHSVPNRVCRRIIVAFNQISREILEKQIKHLRGEYSSKLLSYSADIRYIHCF